MIDNIIRAWIAAADPEFGGSLDDNPDTPRRYTPDTWRPPASGTRYVYPNRGKWQVKIPGMRSRLFATIEEAREFVRLHTEDV